MTARKMTNIKDHANIGYTTSKDGTSICYYQLGHGPGLVMLHGIMESANNHSDLALALADNYTVYLPNRRGRGLSGPYGEHYSLQTEIEDLDALLIRTGAHYVFGISLGGLIALHAALQLSSIRKAAIFDPPICFNGSVSHDWLKRYREEMKQDKVAAALVTSMLGAQMGPSLFRRLPRRILEFLTTTMIANEEKKASFDDITFRMLAPTLHYDGELVVETSDKLEEFRTLQTEIFLLGGDRSPSYMKNALYSLEKTLPNSSRVEFKKMGHEGSGNVVHRGQPQRVEQELRKFFN